MSKLEIFVGFAKENEEVAKRLAACIDNSGAKAIRWTDISLFTAAEYIWEDLRQLSRQVDGAMFIFGCDDRTESRGNEGYQPRDNVLLEYGLFSGFLPQQAVAFYRVGNSKTPVDLGGLICINDQNAEFTASAQLRVEAWLKKLPEVKRKSLDPILSNFPLIEFKMDDEKVPRVHRYSSSCRDFYGYDGNADLYDIAADDLVKKLQKFVDPPSSHWDDFQEDQRILNETYKVGGVPLAHVPIHFNETTGHPNANKTFVPLIVERHGGEGCNITRVLYLDIDKLPKGVFGLPVWSDLCKKIDAKKLSIELEQIAKDWEEAVTGVAPERVKALRAAAEEAAMGGSIRVVTLCGEAGFYAVRTFAHKGDYPFAQRLLRQLIVLTEDPKASAGVAKAHLPAH